MNIVRIGILCMLFICVIIIFYLEIGEKFIEKIGYKGPVESKIKSALRKSRKDDTDKDKNRGECDDIKDKCILFVNLINGDENTTYIVKKDMMKQIGEDFDSLKKQAEDNFEVLFENQKIDIMISKKPGPNAILYKPYTYIWTIVATILFIVIFILSIIM